METVKVFQIGLHDFGRHGFEKFIELQNHYSRVNVELAGVCDLDIEKLKNAEKFASSQDVEPEFFTSVEDIYEAAEKAAEGDQKVMIYDAGPADLHAEHIYRSLRHGFFHLAEKPPSMTREDHIKEKKLMLDNDVRYTVDFIERESPVIKKISSMIQDEEIDSIEAFRESTLGIQKILQPVKNSGVEGGAVLDKMCHEAYIMDLVDTDLEVEDVEKSLQMPFERNGDSFMTTESGKVHSLSNKVAEGQCTAHLSGTTDVTLHASWLGCSDKCKEASENINSKTGHEPINRSFQVFNGSGVSDEEACFLIIKGERDLFGDLLNNRLFDLETGEELEVPSLLHDRLYRALESSVNCAAGLENNNLSEDELDSFMNLIFDISEHTEETDEFETLKASNERIDELVADKNI